jgi:hypothetical protein
MIPSVFYNPNDETDGRPTRAPKGGMEPSPRMKRALSCITVAMLIRSATASESSRLRRMKIHIMGLRLPVARLASLWRYARDEALMYAYPDRAPLPVSAPDGYSNPEWATAAWLVMRAALSLLVNVPLADRRDAEAFVDIVTTAGHVLPKRQQRRAIGIARRYVASAIKGALFAGGGR